MAPKRVASRFWTIVQQPSFWALVALVFVAFLLGWVYQLSRDTHELAKENRTALAAQKVQEKKLAAAIKHQCLTDDAHDVAVQEFIRKENDLDALEALFALHFLLIDKTTCRDVTG